MTEVDALMFIGESILTLAKVIGGVTLVLAVGGGIAILNMRDSYTHIGNGIYGIARAKHKRLEQEEWERVQKLDKNDRD